MTIHTLPLATLLTAKCQTVPEWTAWYRKHGIEPRLVVRVRMPPKTKELSEKQRANLANLARSRFSKRSVA